MTTLRPNQHPWVLIENKYYMILLVAVGIFLSRLTARTIATRTIAAEYCLNCRKYSHYNGQQIHHTTATHDPDPIYLG